MSSSSSIESILDKEGLYLFAGSGNSMWPLIRDGVDTVEVRPVFSMIKKGDVVLFHNAERYVLHRVIKVTDNILTVRGDNNFSYETVPENKVIGTMTGLWRGDKKISLTSAGYRLYSALCVRSRRLSRIVRTVFWR